MQCEETRGEAVLLDSAQTVFGRIATPKAQEWVSQQLSPDILCRQTSGLSAILSTGHLVLSELSTCSFLSVSFLIGYVSQFGSLKDGQKLFCRSSSAAQRRPNLVARQATYSSILLHFYIKSNDTRMVVDTSLYDQLGVKQNA